jgi:hypothetical protein
MILPLTVAKTTKKPGRKIIFILSATPYLIAQPKTRCFSPRLSGSVGFNEIPCDQDYERKKGLLSRLNFTGSISDGDRHHGHHSYLESS